jgi:hypothetical protein
MASPTAKFIGTDEDDTFATGCDRRIQCANAHVAGISTVDVVMPRTPATVWDFSRFRSPVRFHDCDVRADFWQTIIKARLTFVAVVYVTGNLHNLCASSWMPTLNLSHMISAERDP